MSMEARMTDSTAGNQAKIAWPRLTRHINKHTQTDLTWRHKHKAKVGGINYKKQKNRQIKPRGWGRWLKCSAFKGTRTEVKKPDP